MRAAPFCFLLLLCLVASAFGQRRRFSFRSWRRTTTTTTTTPPQEEEEEEEAPKGYSVDGAKTRVIYRELLDGRDRLSDSFRDQFLRQCGRKNPADKCSAYYRGILLAKAKIFYKFGVGMEEYEETMSAILEKCLTPLDSIARPQNDEDDLDSEALRFNRWRTCIYNQTIHIWFMGSIGEVKLQFLLVCPGPIQRCLAIFDDKLTTVLSYVHDNYEVSLADLHSRTAQIVFKCGHEGSSRRMYPFRRCIDTEAKRLDRRVRLEEPKKN